MPRNNEAPRGEMRFVPEGAVVVYPRDLVHEMLGYDTPGSTRKDLSRRGIRAVVGYDTAEIRKAIDNYDPERSWPRRRGDRTR